MNDHTTPSAWPSLAPQRALAQRLEMYASLERWFDVQLARVDDLAFARRFSDHIDLPGIVSGDYAHRLVRTPRGRLLGGIRFYGHDLARPFVEVVAHDFGDAACLVDAVAAEWRAFAPLHLRMIVAHGATLPAGGHVDMSVHLARYADMRPPDGRARLTSFQDAEDAVVMVAERYAAVAQADPALARNIQAAEPNDLRGWHAAGRLAAIRVAGEPERAPVGLLAVAPGAVEWIEGDEVCEEVIVASANGQGYARSAQGAWAARPDADPDRLMVGTIDRLNVASRRSAEGAGRAAVLDYAFVPLPARG